MEHWRKSRKGIQKWNSWNVSHIKWNVSYLAVVGVTYLLFCSRSPRRVWQLTSLSSHGESSGDNVFHSIHRWNSTCFLLIAVMFLFRTINCQSGIIRYLRENYMNERVTGIRRVKYNSGNTGDFKREALIRTTSRISEDITAITGCFWKRGNQKTRNFQEIENIITELNSYWRNL